MLHQPFGRPRAARPPPSQRSPGTVDTAILSTVDPRAFSGLHPKWPVNLTPGLGPRSLHALPKPAPWHPRNLPNNCAVHLQSPLAVHLVATSSGMLLHHTGQNQRAITRSITYSKIPKIHQKRLQGLGPVRPSPLSATARRAACKAFSASITGTGGVASLPKSRQCLHMFIISHV